MLRRLEAVEIKVTAQRMLEILAGAGLYGAEAKAVILDLVLATSGEKLEEPLPPVAREFEESDELEAAGDTPEESTEQPAPARPRKRRVSGSASFSLFGGPAKDLTPA
jgi:hypothetical protein